MDSQGTPRTGRPLALVTGAGIRGGRAVALELGRAGYDVVVHAHASRDKLDAVCAELAALGATGYPVTCDLSDMDAVAALAADVVARFGALHALVHSAAAYERIAFEDIDVQTYRRMQAINTEAPFFLTQGLLPALRAAETGGQGACIVHIVDAYVDRAIAGYSHYLISKMGLWHLTRQLAVELAPIRVNAIGPGAVGFPADFSEARKAQILAKVPLHTEGSFEDVARSVRFLVCDAPYISGQMLNVDGGRSARL